MKLINNSSKGDKYLTVHYYSMLNEINVFGWQSKPDLDEKQIEYQIGEKIEL